MRTIADLTADPLDPSTWRRSGWPIRPNGCGPRVLYRFIPDRFLGTDHKRCCDMHDLDHWRGGFVHHFIAAQGRLWWCMSQRYGEGTAGYWKEGSYAKAVGTGAMAALAPTLYAAATTAFGWMPGIWPWGWRRRDVPELEWL